MGWRESIELKQGSGKRYVLLAQTNERRRLKRLYRVACWLSYSANLLEVPPPKLLSRSVRCPSTHDKLRKAFKALFSHVQINVKDLNELTIALMRLSFVPEVSEHNPREHWLSLLRFSWLPVTLIAISYWPASDSNSSYPRVRVTIFSLPAHKTQ